MTSPNPTDPPTAFPSRARIPEFLANETTVPLVAELREKRVEVETSAGRTSSRRTKARHDDIRH